MATAGSKQATHAAQHARGCLWTAGCSPGHSAGRRTPAALPITHVDNILYARLLLLAPGYHHKPAMQLRIKQLPVKCDRLHRQCQLVVPPQPQPCELLGTQLLLLLLPPGAAAATSCCCCCVVCPFILPFAMPLLLPTPTIIKVLP